MTPLKQALLSTILLYFVQFFLTVGPVFSDIKKLILGLKLQFDTIQGYSPYNGSSHQRNKKTNVVLGLRPRIKCMNTTKKKTSNLKNLAFST